LFLVCIRLDTRRGGEKEVNQWLKKQHSRMVVLTFKLRWRMRGASWGGDFCKEGGIGKCFEVLFDEEKQGE